MVGKLNICSMKKSAVSAGGDRRLAQMDEFGGALAERLYAQYPRRNAFAQQGQEPRGFAGDVCARDFAEIGAPDDQVDFLRRGLALRQADAGDLGNRVYTGRHQAGVGGRRQPEGGKGGAPPLIGGRACQCRRPDGIAGREHSRNIRLEPRIHLHVAAVADGELQPVEADAVQIGDAAERGEDDVGDQGCAVRAPALRPAKTRRSVPR